MDAPKILGLLFGASSTLLFYYGVAFLVLALGGTVRGPLAIAVPKEQARWCRAMAGLFLFLGLGSHLFAGWLVLRVASPPVDQLPTGTPESAISPPSATATQPPSPTTTAELVESADSTSTVEPESPSASPAPVSTGDAAASATSTQVASGQATPYPEPEVCAGSFPRASQPFAAWPYVVKNGETLEDLVSVFRPYLGDAPLDWRDVCEANQSVIGQDCASMERAPQIHSGQLLTIPGVTIPITYEVGSSDSLVRIAARFYGKFHDNSQPLWHRIYCDNYGIIGYNPSRLNLGQQLSIYPLRRIELPEYAVRSGDSLSALARAFYNDETAKSSLCDSLTQQGHEDCWQLVPHQILELSPVPEGVPYTVQPEDTLEWIAVYCYGRADKASQIHLANRMVLGDDPCCVHPGQQLLLYECTVSRSEN